MKRTLSDLQESDSLFPVGCIDRGDSRETVSLFLRPGQEIEPLLPERFEMILVPQKGWGVMTVNGIHEIDLLADTLYYERAGRTVLIRNTGDVPLQLLITMVPVKSVANLLKAALFL